MSKMRWVLLVAAVAVVVPVVKCGTSLYSKTSLTPPAPTDEQLWSGRCGDTLVELRHYRRVINVIEGIERNRTYLRWHREEDLLELDGGSSFVFPRNLSARAMFRYRGLGEKALAPEIFALRSEDDAILHFYPTGATLDDHAMDEVNRCLTPVHDGILKAASARPRLYRDKMRTLVLWNRRPPLQQTLGFYVPKARSLEVYNTGAIHLRTVSPLDPMRYNEESIVVGGLVPVDDGLRLQVDLTRAGLAHEMLGEFKNERGQGIEEYFDQIAATEFDSSKVPWK